LVDLSEDIIESALLCRISIKNYRTGPTATPEDIEGTFSDYYRELAYDGYNYSAMGSFLGITSSRSEIRGSGDSVTISITGIPNERVQDIIYSDIKGSFVRVYRAVFDPITGEPDTVIGRFFGRVNTYSLDEQLDVLELAGSYTINLECSSVTSVFQKFVNGRRTNPIDQRFLSNNSDVAFDRIPTLQSSNFVFGAPK
jgi:hypothetical protein